MTRVAIAAATPALRAGLRAMLSAPDIEVVGDSATLDAGALAGADVVIVANDELLAGRAWAPAAGRLPAVVALSNDERIVDTLRALAVAGWGILPPDAPAAAIHAAVVAVAGGLAVLPSALAGRLLGPRVLANVLTVGADDEPLTGREREVLELLSQGLSNKQIARQLLISEHTVKFHVSSIYAKLGAGSRTEAVSRGAHRGLITL